MDVKPCPVCEATRFEYNDESCRNVCLQCCAMQDPTDISINVFPFNAGINFKSLQKVNLTPRRRQAKYNGMKEHIKQMTPFKLEDMFHWIFEQQVEAMRPFVKDWEQYHSFCECLWTRYMEHSGSGFELVSSQLEDIRCQKYPLGWGAPLDPNRVEETLSITPRDFYKRREQELSEEDEMDILNRRNNAKKLKIEKMVTEKIKEEMTRKKKKRNIEDTSGSNTEVHSYEDNLKRYGMNGESDFVLFDSDESSLSDENDTSYINFYEIKGRQKNIVRVMRKKKESQVRYIGGRSRSTQLLMENNILILFYALHLTDLGTVDCCCLMDIWRLAKKGDIPFLKIGRFLPVHLYFIQHTVFQSIILRDEMPKFRDMKHYSFYLAETLQLELLVKPNFGALIARFLVEFNLPVSMSALIDYIRINIETKMDKFYNIKKDSSIVNTKLEWTRFKMHSHYILFPELCSLAYIFMVMRILLRLDGIFEMKVSNMAMKLEEAGICDYGPKKEKKLFIWSEWLKQSYQPPTLFTASTWNDFGRVTNARTFFEEGLHDEDKHGLDRNTFVNSCGRFVQQYKTGTHDNVISALIKPLSDAMAGVNVNNVPRQLVDFTNSSIEYLVAPEQYKAEINRSNRVQYDSQIRWRTALDDLTNHVITRPLVWEKMAMNSRRYADGVFEEQLVEGMDSDMLYKVVEDLSKAL